MSDASLGARRFPWLAKNVRRIAVCCVLLCSVLALRPARAQDHSPTPATAAIPATPKRPVVDEYFGVKVTDDYRWLENWDDPAVREWSDAENRRARAYLDGLAVREPIKRWLTEIERASKTRYNRLSARGKTFFALKLRPPKNQRYLIRLTSLDDPASAHIIVDPNQIDAKGTTAIDFYVPSLDAGYVAVSLSEGGSEEGTLHVYEVRSAKETGDVIPRVNKGTAGGSVAWNGDGSGFFYTRYPAENERPKEDLDFYQQIYFHKLGTPISADTYALGKEFPRIAETSLHTSRDGRYVIARVANGDGGEFAFYLADLTRGRDASWTQVSQFSDKVTQAAFGQDGSLYLLSNKNASRGKVLKLALANATLANAETVVPESDGAIDEIVPSASLLYVVDVVGGPSRIRIFDTKGHAKGEVPLLPASAAYGAFSPQGDELIFGNESYVAPSARYRYEPGKGADKGTVQRTALYESWPVNFDDAEVAREWAVSKDGTKIPMSVIRRKGLKPNGTAPTLLTGYGGYDISETPYFSPELRLWLDRGGVWVDANLRGGAEYGEEWHHGGNLTRKQNVFDDFAACAKHLMDAGYTSPAKLAIMGGSNGGLLMGAELVQHPEMYRAVVSFVGIYDMLRLEAISSNAVFNITEYGSVKDPEQFKALYAYSPYQHVVDGTAYPAVLFLTGANDPRVNPANSRKMTARLQAASSSKWPILLRTSSTTGHGIDTGLDERIESQSDMYAFLF